MGMTITEKILASHAGKKEVKPGEFIEAKVDVVLGNDITTPVAIESFEAMGAQEVFDKEKVVIVPDHFTPNKDISSAEHCAKVRKFVREKGIKHYYEVGRMGIEHVLLPEQGLVAPGDVIIGADSHTCTYGALGAFSTGIGSTDMAAGMATGRVWIKVPESIKFIYHGKRNPWVGGKDFILYTIGKVGVEGARYQSMEISGEAIDELSMDDRFTMSNMAIEAGGKNGIIAPDQTTLDYVKGRVKRNYTCHQSDSDARYTRVIDIDVSQIRPQIAFPHSPGNTHPVDEAGHVLLDQVVIGSCTNGRIEDMRITAQILKGKQVHPYLRLIILPGSQDVVKQMIQEGIMETFIESGAAVSTPTCGACMGGHMGVLAKGEKSLSTTNRNFVGRMGHPESEIYLSGPAVAAASAIAGRIVHPKEVF